ncbi:hypothetical protein [Flavobacterium sp.]|uniref:hypothetical protein n=1 Tax=Flavobacterium sp. TaxID=239 RepID=UPI004047945B
MEEFDWKKFEENFSVFSNIFVYLGYMAWILLTCPYDPTYIILGMIVFLILGIKAICFTPLTVLHSSLYATNIYSFYENYDYPLIGLISVIPLWIYLIFNFTKVVKVFMNK